MAGAKQHFIPQSLLRGFAVVRPKKAQVCVYPRHGSPFVTATDGIAAKRYFYSDPAHRPGEETLDDRITDHEQGLADDLIELRAASLGGPIDPQMAARVIAHLSVRNAHFRNVFGNAAGHLYRETTRKFEDPHWVGRLLGLDQPEPGGGALDLIRGQFEKLSVPDALRPQLERVFFDKLRSDYPSVLGDMGGKMQQLRELAESQLAEIMRGAHGKALENLEPAARVAHLAELEWRVTAPPDGASLILPDCIALACIQGDDCVRPYIFASGEDQVSCALMPVSEDRLLIGEVPNHPPIELHNLNTAMAAASEAFFIAKSRDDELVSLQPLIGTTNAAFLEPLLQDALAIDPGRNGV